MLKLKQAAGLPRGHITHIPILSFGVHGEWIGYRDGGTTRITEEV
jgi:hypothetical protein